MPFGNRKKNILEDLFSLVLSKFKNYRPSGNLKFNTLGIFQSLKLRALRGKILPISLKLNFTPNNLGCSGMILVKTDSLPPHVLLDCTHILFHNPAGGSLLYLPKYTRCLSVVADKTCGICSSEPWSPASNGNTLLGFLRFQS